MDTSLKQALRSSAEQEVLPGVIDGWPSWNWRITVGTRDPLGGAWPCIPEDSQMCIHSPGDTCSETGRKKPVRLQL